eukprot:9492611-Pyramimonas_sp.AAC.1
MIKKSERVVKPILVVPPHEALYAEVVSTASLLDDIKAGSEWASAYDTHPSVIAAKAQGRRAHPRALYIDGVRYTRAIGVGRQD